MSRLKSYLKRAALLGGLAALTYYGGRAKQYVGPSLIGGTFDQRSREFRREFVKRQVERARWKRSQAYAQGSGTYVVRRVGRDRRHRRRRRR